jgi:cobalamin synthase
MSEKVQTFVEVLAAWGSGVLSTLMAAFMGRMMWHSTEVRKGRRRPYGPELFWEIPVVLGMWFVGTGVAAHFQLTDPVSGAVVVALAYLGPRGIEALFLRWFSRRIDS